jgi:predicted permease
MAWPTRFFRRRQIFRDLADEIQQHIDEKIEALMTEGLCREDAEFVARRDFGNVTRIEERGREMWMWPLAESVWADAKYAMRQLAKNPGFAATAILALALGIGAATAIFSLVDAVLLKPLPFPGQDRLMWLAMQDHSLPGMVPESLSYPDYFDWRAQNHTFEGMATYSGGGATLEVNGESQRIDDQTVSANFFQVLGVAPVVGRDFRWEDEKAGHRAVMLSYSLWQSAFDSAPDIAGRTITMDGRAYSVAGVMPRGFQFPLDGPPSALWLSLAEDVEGKKTGMRGFDVLSLVGRLKPGVTVEEAKADLSVITGNLAKQYPDTNSLYTSALVEPELRRLTGDTKPALRVLSGAVALLLLMACANVAGLLLARSSRRSAEFALRAAIGASRWTIIRQVLVESLLLSLFGGIAGVGLAYALVHATVTLVPLNIPRLENASVDGRVLLFAVAVCVIAGVLLGVAPAWRMSRSMPAMALRSGTRTVAGDSSRNRIHNALVVAQTAIGLVLLVSSGLLIRSFIRILNVDPGFDPHHVWTARFGVSFNKLKHDEHFRFYEQLISQVSSLPGVQSVSAGWPLPLSRNFASISFNIQGQPVARGDEPSEALLLAMPGYFETMRIPLISGRTFGEQDGLKGAPTIIINHAFARKYFPNENPLGHHIQVRLGDDVFEQSIREIVGVVGDIKLKGLTAEAVPEHYLPYAQAVITNLFLAVRTTGDPAALHEAIREAVQQIDRSVPVYQAASLEDYLSKSAAQPRFQTLVLSGFAAVALILSAIGLYGLLSYVVVQRTVEIGVRMALGAQKGQVLGMMVRRGLKLALIGTGAGLAISAVVTRLLSGILYGTRPLDPVSFVAMSILLLAVSLAATSVPAYRASRLDPIQTLREQ